MLVILQVARCVHVIILHYPCKVFDRAQPVGISIGYNRSLNILSQAGDEAMDELVEAVKVGKRFRIAGDNINWTDGIFNTILSF